MEGRNRVAELEALLDEKSAKLAKSWEKQLNKTYEVEQIRSELLKADGQIERLRAALQAVIDFEAGQDFTQWARVIDNAKRALEGKD